MNHSDSISKLSAALVSFHSKMGKVSKDNVNPYFNSKYASLSTILTAVTPVLTESGLSIIQLPTGDNELQTVLMHTSGEWISSTMKLTPVKSDPQSQGSAITYARRYAVGAILSLNIDEDDDANAATHGPKQNKATPPVSSPTPAPRRAPAPRQAPVPRQSAQVQPQAQQKPWLNITDRSGQINDLGHDTASRIVDGSYTWELLYSDYRISKRDKTALDAYIAEIEQKSGSDVEHAAANDVDQPLPF